MAIKPISLPQGGGLDYGKGDVRHFSPGDAVSVPGIANPTRYLAERDNLLSDKVNEVIETVNNQEQFVPLPVIRTVVSPSDEVVAMNYRIPPGFESRVLNAVVSSVEGSTDIELNIYYADSFGNSAGTNIVSTATEFTGGVDFYQTGEFIITLKNTGGVSLELAASVLLTLRPIGAQGTLLVGTIIKGEKGDTGPTGPPGPPGSPGSGGAGTPGMIWQGPWVNGNSYNVNDVVSYALYGSITSSYICRVANTASTGVNDPQTDSTSTWNAVAIGGATGTGQQGPPGAIINAPIYTFNPFSGTLITGGDWVAGSDTSDGYLGSGLSASGTYTNLSLNEFKVTTGTTAFALVYGTPKLYFKGHGTLRLPTTGDGTAFNYSNGFIKLTVIDNGTQSITTASQTIVSTGVASGTSVTTWGTYAGQTASNGGHSVSVYTASSPNTDFVVAVNDNNPVKVQLSFFGAQNS